MPKKFPQEINFRSASVDYSEDQYLTIPVDDLAILNEQDWYGTPTKKAWEIANKYFQILFFILYKEPILVSIVKNFQGVAILRAYGLHAKNTYSLLLKSMNRENNLDMLNGSYNELECKKSLIQKMGERFFFGIAYEHLYKIEEPFLQQQSLFLPLGLLEAKISNEWVGSNPRIFFVCPEIAFNPYYQKIYHDFIRDFREFPYSIGGAQSLPVSDPNVLGFVTAEQHKQNMREMRLMFYHSREPNHIHYHPFEAISTGMPLIFMSGGILEQRGGKDQPGLCRSIKEARLKIRRVLQGDREFIEAIRKNQVRMLEPMSTKNCIDSWQKGFALIRQKLEKITYVPIKTRKKRIAVFLPELYRGGSLRAAKLVATALYYGCKQYQDDVEIVFAHREHESFYPDSEFADMPKEIKRRAFDWKVLTKKQAHLTLMFAKKESDLRYEFYVIPDDGINNFLDCDLWFFISDRMSYPLLKIRPYLCIVYDYIQRYEPNIVTPLLEQTFFNFARNAEAVLVTTEFTKQDALNYAGISPSKIHKLPMLVPDFSKNNLNITSSETLDEIQSPYFIWTTNAAPHKNHVNTVLALQEYYERYEGTLECHITGVNTKNILSKPLPHLQATAEIVNSSDVLKRKLFWLGDFPDTQYQRKLSKSNFLLHSAKIDNGTFSVIEAAYFNLPSLSSIYPAMKEINAQFNLNLTWMDPYNPADMAKQLKFMELNAMKMKGSLPSLKQLASQNIEKLAQSYWEAVRVWL